MRLALLALLACPVLAQKVEVSNHSEKVVVGWFQTNIDSLPPVPSGSYLDKCNFVVGKKTGLDTWHVDVYTIAHPGEHLTLDLGSVTTGGPYHLPPPPENNYLGGVSVRIGGVKMTQQSAVQNGAGYDFAYTALVGSLLRVHLFLHWYPDQRGWCRGEVVVTASNPAVPDVVAHIPANFRLQIGDANIFVPGLGQDPLLLQEGDWLADGQRRALPLTIVWPEHCGEYDGQTASAWHRMLVGIRGISKLHLDGNPPLPAGFDALTWARDALPEVVARQHDWLISRLDPAMDSGATGAQGSQPPGCAGPAMAHPLAVLPIYVTALDASWPMFHMEQDGSVLRWNGHPGLRLNRGRVNRAISTDTLGKANEPSSHERHQYTGPEWEHWFDWHLFAGARFMGTPGLQLNLEGHAVQFLHNFVVEGDGQWLPPSRGIGWLSFLAVELYRNLENRELAEAIKTRWIALFHQQIRPKFEHGGFWSWSNDPRIGASDTDLRAAPWQAAVGVAGVNWAAFQFVVPEAWELAGVCIAEFMEKTYVKQGSYWTTRDLIAMNGADLGWYGVYDNFGNPLGVSCTLRLNPGHWFALEIWAQLTQDTNLGHASWLVRWQQP